MAGQKSAVPVAILAVVGGILACAVCLGAPRTTEAGGLLSQCVKFAVRNYGAALQAAGVLEEVPPLIVGADAVQEKVPEARYLIANANAIGEEVRAYLEKFPNGTAFVPYDQLVDLNEGDVDPGLSQWWWTMPVAYTGASQPGQVHPDVIRHMPILASAALSYSHTRPGAVMLSLIRGGGLDILPHFDTTALEHRLHIPVVAPDPKSGGTCAVAVWLDSGQRLLTRRHRPQGTVSCAWGTNPSCKLLARRTCLIKRASTAWKTTSGPAKCASL